ncbi:hypothetical protein PJF56_03180 [Roseofilum sp. BLCC_M91]|uniref:Uncharacterized protein n=1 Tax=Roseofilum halophilum BLCC-M91 TaxID=3022259 RepID=A0ABT7BFL1_9CYAN|nr:hypothetical protein [Roseofilum halophilum]MDJ1177860.1 hypothetical protein [Roseofilum halophilum BLCC-M91]
MIAPSCRDRTHLANKRLERILAEMFGGFSSFPLRGGYVTKGELEREKVVLVTACSDCKAMLRSLRLLSKELVAVGEELEQEAILAKLTLVPFLTFHFMIVI